MPNVNDSKGKLYEISLGKSISIDASFPVHFRKEGKGPEEVSLQCSELLGEAESSRIYDMTYEMASVVTGQLVQDQLMANTVDVKSVCWSSFPDGLTYAGDHEKFTGIKDINSDADLLIETISGNHIGLSAKYGSKQTPNLRNIGLNYFENLLDMRGSLYEILNVHRNYRLKGLGFDQPWTAAHEEYKKLRVDGDPRARQAEESMSTCLKQIAETIRRELSLRSSDFLKSMIRDVICPKTVHPHYRIQTKTSSSSHSHRVYSIEEKTDEVMDSYSEFSVLPSEGSTVVRIKGKRKYDSKMETVFYFTVKGTSGPMLGINVTSFAPMLNEKRTKRVLHAFDLDETLFWHDGERRALVQVLDGNGQVVEVIPTGKYSNYVLPQGCHFDYTQHTDAETFEQSARPIEKVLEKLKKLQSRGKKVAIVTARGDFTDMDKFRKVLESHGIETDNLELFMTGDMKDIPHDYDRKKEAFRREILKWKYDQVDFYDDREYNLQAFLGLSEEFPDVEFVARRVTFDPETETTKIKRTKPWLQFQTTDSTTSPT